ncbi:MAG: tail fiber domain-containing protein [Methylobacter sp.]
MDINKKNRSDLKSYFVKNSIPTESNFAELIDGMLNQKDDGIVKLSGDPLSIESAGDSTGLQKVINFYAKFQDANPSWSLQLNPRIDPNTPATAKTGFCVADGKGAARLFIDQATGNIGLGVVNPNGKLDVAGQVRIGFDEGGAGVRSISFTRDAGDEGNAGKIAYRGGFGQDALHIVGAGTANNARKIKLWDNTEVTNLTALGAITPSGGNSVSNGILFKNNIAGDTTDSAWIRYYARSAELMTLEIGTANDDTDHIALMPSGNVGIGLNNPLYSFDVKASKGIKLGLEGSGGGQLILKNNKDDNKIYIEAFSKDGTASAAELLLTGINAASAPKISLVADVTNITGNAGIGLASTATPIAKLDIAQAARSGAHPTAVKGLYITGDFGPDADGIELRHSNATQGIGFGYNTIYAAGSNSNQDLQLKPKGTGALQLLGKVDISDGSNTGIVNNMANGSLAIGSTTVSYGGGNNWNSNTAGLMLQTLANTEIAVHDSGTRITSLMYYQGDSVNKITIGRDMGWGITPVAIAGDITLNGSVALGSFTGADADEWPKFTWYRDTANNWDEGLIKHASSRGFFGRSGYGIHLHSSRDWTFFSSGWDALFGIEGGTGNTKIKGMLTIGDQTVASSMSGTGLLALKGTSPQIDFIDTDHNDWSIHVNSNKMYFVRQPWNASDLVLDGAGNVGIGTDTPGVRLDVEGGAFLGYENSLTDFGIPLKSGFYQGVDKIIGDVPDTSHSWSHLITGRHSNVGNNHQLQIASTFASNDKLYFRKIAAANESNNPSWNEVATRGANVFSGNQLFLNGMIGIGTDNPTEAKLVVRGSANLTLNGYGYLNRNGASATNTTYTTPYSIYTDQRIAAVEFNAHSDERIKTIQSRSNSAADLQTLLSIEITDYHYKDVIEKGSAPQKKVIAQQVDQVFPQSVSKHTDVVPDIYQQAAFVDGWVELATDLKAGERVRLISDNVEGVYEVLDVAKNKFRTEFKPEGDKVFVYGREVNDFCNVDYDAIAMLNVSATQQIKKEMDSVVDALKAENAALKARLDALEAKIH